MASASRTGDGIAVVGVACRMPGAPDPAALWALLRDGTEAIREPPRERALEIERGGFLESVDEFDAEFFGLSPREAVAADPQQRLALELSWEGLEDARITRERLAGAQVGVFLGVMADDYAGIVSSAGPTAITPHTLTGIGRAVIANRISFFLGFRGPSLTVDTGQSSSLVAVHLACESLRKGESEVALAGGVDLMLSSRTGLALAKFGALSPDGRCYAFDSRANGLVPGEGGGVVVLKPLARAREDEDRIYGVIRGSAVTTGSGDGLFVPSEAAQTEMVRKALAEANVDAADVQYVELHGTGTPVGDPIEAAALGAVYGRDRPEGDRLAIGSVKTNIGHLGGAAGIAGLIKATLCVHRGELVPSLNFATPNPRIPLGELNLRVVEEGGPWPRPGQPAIGGVSSFGVGGANCHVVLGPEPERSSVAAVEAPPPPSLAWPLSAKTEPALRAQAERLAKHLEAVPELGAVDVGFTLATARTPMEHRAVVVGSGRDELLARVKKVARGEPDGRVVQGIARAASSVAFVFPGQGAQWSGMGLSLWDSVPGFAESIERCADALSQYVDWSLRAVLEGASGAPSLERVEVVQPALFATTVALAETWQSFGVVPDLLAGHSQGEIAAAHVAGALSLEDAARVVALRSAAIADELAGAGGMLSVALGAHEVERRLEGFEGLSLAVANGPRSSVVSGAPDELERLRAACEADEIRARMVAVDYASHSPQVEVLRERLATDLAGLEPRPAERPFYSTMAGGPVDGDKLDGEYWYRSLLSQVRFEELTRRLVTDGADFLLEVSPHPVLVPALEETVDTLPEADGIAIHSTLRRDEGGPERLVTALGEAYADGAPVDLEPLYAGARPKRVDLPTYPFQRRRYWLEQGAGTGDVSDAGLSDPDDPVLDGAVETPTQGLDALPAAELEPALLELVRSESAAVLGRSGPDVIDPKLPFKKLGFDSLRAVELRNRLVRASGLRLVSTVVYDHPTPVAMAKHLLELVSGAGPSAAGVLRTARSEEPIAIVGMACRFPGDVRSPDQLWGVVDAGRDVIGPLPTNRGWDVDRLYDPDPDHSGTSYAREGGFVYDADEFDAAFFGISPREAVAMDPQQRLLLEAAWEAFERAGVDPTSLQATDTGVFAGLSIQDYESLSDPNPGEVEGFRLTGALGSVLAGRVAYTLGLEGPAVSIDTACSSSLVALHLARQSLRSGECSLALAGGVTVMSSPGMFIEFSRQRGLSADGRCRPYSREADGTGWSEGAGLVVLERLSDAERNGHEVLAVVRGSAVNQDGASNGLTAPNGPSQERVIRQALASAGLSAAEVDAVEGHGTGTALGDPIEAQALLATYGAERDGGGPLALGSIKSNIGHTSAAAGVAGVIKMVMALRRERLPRSLHCDEPSPHVDWSAGDVELLAEAREWPRTERPRRAGVSSFGISGTNAHVILEEAPAPAPDRSAEESEPAEPPVLVWPLSAKTEGALRTQAERLARQLAAEPELRAADVAFTLATARAKLEQRAAIAGSGRDELVAGLKALAAGESARGLVMGRARSASKLAFVFPGQGAQWQGMGIELWDSVPTFAESIERCAAALAEHVDWSLRSVLEGSDDAPSLERVEVVQPALFAMMVALAETWQSFGVVPDLVAGHSQGEIAAAHIAGALSLEDAARVVALRSAAIADALAGAGGMLSVALGAAELEERLANFSDLSLAAVNSPRSSVVSGAPDELECLRAACEADDVRARMVAVDYASHSPQVEALRERLATDLADLEPRPAKRPFYSTMAAGPVEGETLDGDYWYRSLLSQVRFEELTRRVVSDGADLLVEVSPHPVLVPALEETLDTLPDAAVAIRSTLRRDEGGPERLASALGEAYVDGAPVNLEPLYAAARPQRVALPTYPFERRRYWLEQRTDTGDVSAAGLSDPGHPLLGAAVALADEAGGSVMTGRVSLATHPWLADHTVLDTVLVPGAALVELALAAGAELGAEHLDELVLEAPLVLAEDAAVELQLRVGAPDEDDRRAVSVFSRPVADRDAELPAYVRHASGTLSAASADPAPAPEAWPPEGAEAADVEYLYDTLAEAGFGYGRAFQGLRAAWTRGDEVFAEVELPEELEGDADSFAIHPTLLDACLHALFVAARGEPGEVRLPFAFEGVRLDQPGVAALRVRARRDGERLALSAYDESGAAVVAIEAMTTRPLDQAQLAGARPAGEALYAIDWVELDAGTDAASAPERIATLGPLQLQGKSAYPDLHAIAAEGDGTAAPSLVVWALPDPDGDGPDGVRTLLSQTLAQLKEWLAQEALGDARLVILSAGAQAAGDGESPDPAAAAALGLVRSAQSEHPDRFVVLDAEPGDELPWAAISAAVEAGETQLALRGGTLRAPRIARADAVGTLEPPAGEEAWCVESRRRDAIEDLELIPNSDALAPLAEGQVRVEVRAAGVNFRDVLVALDHYPGAAGIGSEGAGVVTEVGPGVGDLAVGDRVMGMPGHAFGPVAVADRRALVPIPAALSFTEAAALPVVFLTAWFGLFELAGLESGEAVLIHSGAGGVGMAAIQLAKAAGAEVYATAQPAKWPVLRELGLDDDHIASSRDLEFREKFMATSDGRGVDVVLDTLARKYVDASLELLVGGGRFIELGKTDLRDPDQVAAGHPGVAYRPFDLLMAEPDQVARALAQIAGRFETGALERLPVRCFDVREAPRAFRLLREARHVGKVVLTIPRALDPDGTVLLTGATGTLGAMVARRLAARGARHLVLVSRSGERAAGAGELAGELRELGCEPIFAACDVADRAEVERLIASVPAEHPLTGVVHAAGALADATIDSLDDDHIERALAPKLDAALHLDALTAGHELAQFVLFSSAAAAIGAPGQGAYAAANAGLDALAEQRRARGLAASSIAWGLWERTSGLTAGMTEEDRARLARFGIAALGDEQGLALFDEGGNHGRTPLLALALDLPPLRQLARAGMLPPLFSTLVRAGARKGAGEGALARRLASLADADRGAAALDFVRSEVAAVLGHSGASAVEPDASFKDLGFDSLGAVELRNRLAHASGLRLPVSLVFDHPTPAAAAKHLRSQLGGEQSEATTIEKEFDRLEALLVSFVEQSEDPDRIKGRLRSFNAHIDELVQRGPRHDGVEAGREDDEALESATDDEVLALIDREFGAL